MNTSAKTKQRNRYLYYFPIIHTQNDMGGLKKIIELTEFQIGSKGGLTRKKQIINQLWVEIEKSIEDLSLHYHKVKVYQDGLPVCGRELEIVQDLANIGSVNHQILLRLTKQGARLVGTESAELLLKEYQLIKQIIGQVNVPLSTLGQDHQRLFDSILKERDTFIAQRINKTLKSGETGVIFIGMLHCLKRWLEPDIKVIHKICTPENETISY